MTQVSPYAIKFIAFGEKYMYSFLSLVSCHLFLVTKKPLAFYAFANANATGLIARLAGLRGQ
jgi:hypothetical protein